MSFSAVMTGILRWDYAEAEERILNEDMTQDIIQDLLRNVAINFREYARSRDYVIVSEWSDRASGADLNRPQLDEMLRKSGSYDAQLGKESLNTQWANSQVSSTPDSAGLQKVQETSEGGR